MITGSKQGDLANLLKEIVTAKKSGEDVISEGGVRFRTSREG